MCLLRPVEMALGLPLWLGFVILRRFMEKSLRSMEV